MSTFKQFTSDDIVQANPTEVTVGLWTGDTGSLTTFFTSSVQASGSTSGRYYWNVYNIDPNSDSNADIEFAVAYGHRTGGGSPSILNNSSTLLASQAVYSQYRSLLLDPGDLQFTFAGNWNSDHIYVLNVQRSRLREQLDPGNWQLTLKGASGSFTFIDDSGQTLGASFGKTGAVFNVASGSLSGSNGFSLVSSASLSKGGYGLFYPSLGLIVLNPDAISQTCGFVSGSIVTSGSNFFAANTGSTNVEQNHAGLFASIKQGGSFIARSAETISSTHYFVHLRSKEFNYSNNPTFFNETTGVISNSDFVNDPRVYVTTIGLYSAANELLAVGKMSKPIQKGFDKELLVRVRLDW